MSSNSKDSDNNNNSMGRRTSIPRPSLLMQRSTGSPSAAAAGHNVRNTPRRLWGVRDSRLPKIPPFYPRMNPRTTTFVTDAAPSIVAVRISECLRNQSVAVEYDDDAAVANAMTSDRCRFSIQLFRGTRSGGVDLRQGVVVECTRVAGSTITFYKICRQVLLAAQAQSSGKPRPARNEGSLLSMDRSRAVSTTPQSLEHAMDLIRKDRWDCQILGMESLLSLVSASVSGCHVSLVASRALVNEPIYGDLLYAHLMETPQRRHSSLDEQETMASEAPSCVETALTASVTESSGVSELAATQFSQHQAQHEGNMRSLALKVMSQVLNNLEAAKEIQSLPARWTAEPLMKRLLSDVQGGLHRPPVSVASQTQWPSIHESTTALACWSRLVQQDQLQQDSVWETLDEARAQGERTHADLQVQAEGIYKEWAENVRSC